MKKAFLCVMLLVLTTSTNVYAYLDGFDFLNDIFDIDAPAYISVGVQAPVLVRLF